MLYRKDKMLLKQGIGPIIPINLIVKSENGVNFNAELKLVMVIIN